MNTIYNLTRKKTGTWIRLEKDNNQSITGNIIKHIENTGNLRPPQKEALETYLWIKFAANNKKLSDMVREGLLYDDDDALEYDNYHTFGDDFITQFLNRFFQDNDLKNLHKKLVNDPKSEKTDWNALLEELLHNFNYPNYLFSLPMGAGKTFLMACFIYLDLHFANLFKDKNDDRFAHNFVVFAPQASKTAILPSLRTIKDFNPEWILQKNEADELKQIISIEILDSLSSRRKDKLHGNNPNLEKVNRARQTKNFGLVFITNAEKVVLERYKNKFAAGLVKKGHKDFSDYKLMNEVKKSNELREALSQIPRLTVILDEVHHSYGTTGKGEKKLRQAVNVLNQRGNINSVIGLSGTPYVKTKIEVTDKEALKGNPKINLNQIQDIVYNYPLNHGVGVFLKKPDIRSAEVKESAFVKQALDDFFKDYDIEYNNGTKSKIAFYCPSIQKLNDEILPVIKEWYSENRNGKEEEIFRYYSKVDKKNKKYALPKENLAIFNNLDKPYSKKRVVLLVAVGAEGWDCRSLTAVALPRQKTTRNFVLQTACRCLREVDDASKEKALVYLSGDNYETLEKELKANYKLSISDLSDRNERTIKPLIRKPRLGKLKYKQIETKYKIIKRTAPEIRKELSDFEFSKIKAEFPYDKTVTSGKLGDAGITGEIYLKDVKAEANLAFSYIDFIYSLADGSYGLIDESELISGYDPELSEIFEQISKELEWIALNPWIDAADIARGVAAGFMDRIEYAKEIIEKETEIELLEWESEDREMTVFSPDGTVYRFTPKISKRDARLYRRHPDDLLEDYFSAKNNIDPLDVSFNYIPYKMDSEFEQNALAEMLKLSELKNLEVYFNGYKNEKLQSFWIQTPRGKYTPDFLILKRKDGKKYAKNQTVAIDKAIIIETKGKPYYNDEFKAKEKFVKGDFLKHNKHFSYHCFVDEGKNDFKKHLEKFRRILKDF